MTNSLISAKISDVSWFQELVCQIQRRVSQVLHPGGLHQGQEEVLGEQHEARLQGGQLQGGCEVADQWEPGSFIAQDWT